jgi:hypothetical protein
MTPPSLLDLCLACVRSERLPSRERGVQKIHSRSRSESISYARSRHFLMGFLFQRLIMMMGVVGTRCRPATQPDKGGVGSHAEPGGARLWGCATGVDKATYIAPAIPPMWWSAPVAGGGADVDSAPAARCPGVPQRRPDCRRRSASSASLSVGSHSEKHAVSIVKDALNPQRTVQDTHGLVLHCRNAATEILLPSLSRHICPTTICSVVLGSGAKSSSRLVLSCPEA